MRNLLNHKEGAELRDIFEEITLLYPYCLYCMYCYYSGYTLANLTEVHYCPEEKKDIYSLTEADNCWHYYD